MIPRLISYLSGMKRWIALSIVLMVIAKAIEVIVPPQLGIMVQVILGERSAVDPLHTILVGTGFVSILVVVSYLLESGNVLLLNFLGQRGIYRMRIELFHHVQHLHIAFFDKQRVGQLISRTINDIDRIEKGLSEGMISILASSLLLLGIIIGMFVIEWRIASLICATLPFLYLFGTWFRVAQRKSFAQVRSALGRLNTFVQEHLLGNRILRHFGLQRQEQQKFDRLNCEFRDANITTIRHFATFFAGIDWIHSFLITTVFVALVEFGISGEQFRAGIFFTFSIYLLAFFRPVFDLIERYNILQEATAAASRVFEVLDEKPIVRTTGYHPLSKIDTVAFENVWFAYQNQEWVLRDVSFTLTPGQMVALVGETGSGKTTLMSLLLRFYDPQKGRITINSRDIRDYSLHSLRSHCSSVLQDPVIFSGTIADNVALFKESILTDTITNALRYVGAWPLVESLPKGIQTELKERGKSLSSGERQLLSFARAVAHNRDILLLDEATSNIDAFTEKVIQQALNKILAQRTTLVIAHRLSTIRQASEIIVLHHGQIIERGSHEQLLELKGYYEKLYRLQFVE